MIPTVRSNDRFAQTVVALRRQRQPLWVAGECDGAVEYAFGRWSVRYGEWANSLFDRHFLQGEAAQTLAAFAGGEVDQQHAAEQLVAAWDRQFGGNEAARRRQRRDDLTPAAESFLGWLVIGLRQVRRRVPPLQRRQVGCEA